MSWLYGDIDEGANKRWDERFCDFCLKEKGLGQGLSWTKGLADLFVFV